MPIWSLVRSLHGRNAAPAWVLLAAVAALAGCHGLTSPTEPSHSLHTTLAVGDVVTIESGHTLSFDHVVGDSRCPVGVVCVWEGEVTLAFTLREDRDRQQFTLSDHARARVVGRYSFTLDSVRPQPTKEGRIPEEAYRAEVRVHRRWS